MASEGDLATIERIVHSAYKGYIPRIGRQPAPMTDDYRQHVADGNIWLLVQDSQVLGLIVLLPKSNYMLLDNVAVAPENQRCGLGRRLMYFAEVRTRQSGLKEIQLYTNEQMVENIAFYNKLGYQETDRRLDSGFKRVFMKKTL